MSTISDNAKQAVTLTKPRYQCTDGQLFEHEHDAHKNQCIIEAERQLTELVDKHCFSGMRRSDVINMITEQVDELLEILPHLQSVED